jgi:hypothetical protein
MGSNVSFYNFFVVFVAKNLMLTPMREGGNSGFQVFFWTPAGAGLTI